MAEVVEVTRNLHPRFVRNRTLASDVEPAIADVQPIQPILHDVVGDRVVAPSTQGRVAALCSTQTTARSIDATHRLTIEVLTVEIAEVPLALTIDRGDGTINNLLRWLDSRVSRLGKSNQYGPVDETDRT